jgi:glycosyltransferase involved in cell wall biosynthesis
MFGWHLMEAMSYGLPCVAYDVPYGPQDVINDESNGFLVKPNQLVDFASKVGILIRKDDLREEMGKRAYEDISKYEINSIMKEWIKLYESISVR